VEKLEVETLAPHLLDAGPLQQDGMIRTVRLGRKAKEERRKADFW
jgi:hypothetical protein